jgi:hypothetical protein
LGVASPPLGLEAPPLATLASPPLVNRCEAHPAKQNPARAGFCKT